SPRPLRASSRSRALRPNRARNSWTSWGFASWTGRRRSRAEMAEAPLATRMRPRSLDEVVGQQHLIGPGKPLSVLVEAGHISSILLWGPAGSGKTTLAFILGGSIGELVQLS